LIEGGIERVLVNTHYLGSVIHAYMRTSAWRDRVDVIDEERLLGTGGTLLANRAWFGPGPLLVSHADNASDLDIRAFVQAHGDRSAGVLATMALFRTDQPQSCGIVVMDGSNIIREFHEKKANPPGNLANAAAFIFEPQIFDYLREIGNETIDLSAEVMPKLVGRIQGFEISGYHRDIGTPDGLERARRHFVAT